MCIIAWCDTTHVLRHNKYGRRLYTFALHSGMWMRELYHIICPMNEYYCETRNWNFLLHKIVCCFFFFFFFIRSRFRRSESDWWRAFNAANCYTYSCWVFFFSLLLFDGCCCDACFCMYASCDVITFEIVGKRVGWLCITERMEAKETRRSLPLIFSRNSKKQSKKNTSILSHFLNLNDRKNVEKRQRFEINWSGHNERLLFLVD